MTTTTEVSTIKITLSDARPIRIVEADWPLVAEGEGYSGQYDFQSFDGVWIRVRQHTTDGRAIVYGYAGDWDGGGRPDRENLRAGFLVPANWDAVRAIRRVAGILEGTAHVGELAHVAARACIANLPAKEI